MRLPSSFNDSSATPTSRHLGDYQSTAYNTRFETVTDMKRRIISALAMACAALPAPAHAETVGFVAGWRLERGMEGTYSGCVLSRTLPSGVTIAFLRQPGEGSPIRVVLISRGWASLVNGQTYTLNGQIGMKKFTVATRATDTEMGKSLTFDLTWDQYYRGFFNMLNGFFFDYNGMSLVGYSPSSYEREAVIRQSKCIKAYADPFAPKK